MGKVIYHSKYNMETHLIHILHEQNNKRQTKLDILLSSETMYSKLRKIPGNSVCRRWRGEFLMIDTTQVICNNEWQGDPLTNQHMSCTSQI